MNPLVSGANCFAFTDHFDCFFPIVLGFLRTASECGEGDDMTFNAAKSAVVVFAATNNTNRTGLALPLYR